jgi:hypothetical protein
MKSMDSRLKVGNDVRSENVRSCNGGFVSGGAVLFRPDFHHPNIGAFSELRTLRLLPGTKGEFDHIDLSQPLQIPFV